MRALLSAFLALVFLAAVTPGVMAMPAPQNSAPHSMDSLSMAGSPCDHMKPAKEQDSPHKAVHVCMGMIGCFGMAAVTYDVKMPPVPVTGGHVADRHEVVTGLSSPPDDRPPIV